MRPTAAAAAVSRAFPSWKQSILTEIYLCHACSDHEIEDGNARAGGGSIVHCCQSPRLARLLLQTQAGATFGAGPNSDAAAVLAEALLLPWESSCGAITAI